MMVVM